MKFKYTILYVQDVAETLKFYENAFGCKHRMLHEAGDYGELDTGDTTLSFASLKLISEIGKHPQQASPDSPQLHISFETQDVETSLDQAIKAGATLTQELRVEPWGQTTSCVSDLNGFLVEICSPVGQ